MNNKRDDIIFEVIDKTRRKIRLTRKQWDHIKEDHPEVENEELIKETLKKPDKIHKPYDGKKHYYYKYYKDRKSYNDYLIVIVNYLNGDGFVITSYYVRYIKKF